MEMVLLRRFDIMGNIDHSRWNRTVAPWRAFLARKR